MPWHYQTAGREFGKEDTMREHSTGAPLETDEPLETIDETAKWTRLTRSHLYAYTAAGTIPHLKIGKYVRFRRSEVRQWLEAQRRGPRPA
jgi:excisionase family DNA binding protein